MARGATQERGFTLLELMAVFAVIALVLAVAAPRLLPAATYFGHEGAARELAAFGETAIQYAALHNEEILVAFHLDRGEYWAEHWVPEEGHEENGEIPSVAEMQESVLATMNDPNADEDDMAESAEQMNSHFAAFAQQQLRARAELVEPNRSDRAGRSMRASWGENQREARMVKEPLDAPMLEKRKLPEDVFLESITLPDERLRDERVEVVISPLGLERDVRIALVTEDGDVLTVRWDPILGRGYVLAGEAER